MCLDCLVYPQSRPQRKNMSCLSNAKDIRLNLFVTLDRLRFEIAHTHLINGEQLVVYSAYIDWNTL